MTDLVAQLVGALEDLLIDMKIAQSNMRSAAKRDPSWEGCAETIQPRVDAAVAALSAAKDGGWVSPYDAVPQPDQTVLVWSRQTWETAPSLKIDTWSMQREAPLSFSTATIEVGYGWDDHENFESVIAWQPLPNPPKGEV